MSKRTQRRIIDGIIGFTVFATVSTKKRFWCKRHTTIFLPPERCRDCMAERIESLERELAEYKKVTQGLAHAAIEAVCKRAAAP